MERKEREKIDRVEPLTLEDSLLTLSILLKVLDSYKLLTLHPFILWGL